jgi:hypothetical protein
MILKRLFRYVYIIPRCKIIFVFSAVWNNNNCAAIHRFYFSGSDLSIAIQFITPYPHPAYRVVHINSLFSTGFC